MKCNKCNSSNCGIGEDLHSVWVWCNDCHLSHSFTKNSGVLEE